MPKRIGVQCTVAQKGPRGNIILVRRLATGAAHYQMGLEFVVQRHATYNYTVKKGMPPGYNYTANGMLPSCLARKTSLGLRLRLHVTTCDYIDYMTMTMTTDYEYDYATMPMPIPDGYLSGSVLKTESVVCFLRISTALRRSMVMHSSITAENCMCKKKLEYPAACLRWMLLTGDVV